MSLRDYAAERSAGSEPPQPDFEIFGDPPTKSEPERKSTLEREQDRQKQELLKAHEVYAAYQSNTRKAEQITIDISKGLQRGENLAALFLKAVECISLLTDNRVLYSTSKSTIQTVYGIALHERAAADLTAAAVTDRLDKLRQSEHEITDEAAKSRLQQAIREHEKLLKDLE